MLVDRRGSFCSESCRCDLADFCLSHQADVTCAWCEPEKLSLICRFCSKMDSNESPRARKRRATVGLFCCCSFPSDTLEPDSKVVRITAGVIAIVAMLLSGVGFSALQRDTVNPYEHLFVSASSSRHLTPGAWGAASAPAPFLQPILQPSGGIVSAEGTGQGSQGAVPLYQTGIPSAPPAGSVNSAAMAESSVQSPDSTGQAAVVHAGGPQQGPGSEASQGTASVESVAPDSDSLASPGGSPAWSGAPSSTTGMQECHRQPLRILIQ